MYLSSYLPFDFFFSYFRPAFMAYRNFLSFVNYVEFNVVTVAFRIPWVLAAFHLKHALRPPCGIFEDKLLSYLSMFKAGFMESWVKVFL